MTSGKLVLKTILTVLIALSIPILFMVALFLLIFEQYLWTLTLLIIPAVIPLIWLKKRRVYLICFLLVSALLLGCAVGKTAKDAYDESLKIDVTPNINTDEYLPFVEDTKIVKLENASISFDFDPPIIDGATAAFPVYSAFVHATYPKTTRLYDGVFEYNNTLGGYEKLAEQKTDVFFGAYPSAEQREYAEQCGTTFEYTQVASEAFVFFVHKDNPVSSLTSEQIRGIYSGRITNWSEVGGKDEEIMPFQRNEGSGSQSMMLRFMGDTPMIEPKTEEVVGFMGGIIESVADYESRSGSIGFSFRYYVEGIIRHPDIKMIAVDGVAPTVESIKSGAYPIIAPVYAVTYAECSNTDVDRLIEWVLSDEGQYIIEETGYVGVKK